MNKSTDPRHQKRIDIIKILFANSFLKQKVKSSEIIGRINNSIGKIDQAIERAAPQFPINKIAKIDAAILRLAVFELLIEKKEPPKVIIDEAIEIAKEFGSDSSPAFVNGVLGTIYKKYE